MKFYSVALLVLLILPVNSFAQIRYVDVTPDSTLSVHEHGIQSSSMLVDINNNGINDFEIGVSFWEDFLSPSCNDGFRIKIKTVNNYQHGIAEKVCVNGTDPCCLMVINSQHLNSADAISEYLDYGGNVNLAYYSCGSELRCVNNGTYNIYVGIRLNYNDLYYYGWISLTMDIKRDGDKDFLTEVSVSIKDFAYNTKPNEVIYAGLTTEIVEPSENNPISVFPNPSQDIIHITTGDISKSTIQIYNAQGCSVYSEVFTGTNIKIDTGSFPRGLYYINISSDYNSYTKSVVIL